MSNFNKPELIINFLPVETKYCFTSIKILQNTYKISLDNKPLKIIFNEQIFGKEKEKIIIEIELISEFNNNILKFNYNIYYGLNKAYCLLDIPKEKNKRCLAEICFYNENIELYVKDIKLDQKDYFDDSNRKRITLINIDKNEEIDKNNKNISDYIPYKIRNNSSFQISIFNFLKSYYSTQVIFKKEVFYLKQIKLQIEHLKNFHNSLYELLDKKETNLLKYINLINEFKLKIQIIEDIDFSKKKLFLENELKDENNYYLIYTYYLYYILYICFIYNENFPINIIDICKYLKKFYYIYLKDDDLSVYQKIILFISNSLFFISIQNINLYESMNLRYVKKRDIKNNSVCGIAFKFLSDFIKKLNTKSLLFYPLLLLISGKGLYNENELYGFNMESIEVIKNNLNDLIPDIFFIYERSQEELEKSMKIVNKFKFNYKGCPCPFLNISTLLDKCPFDILSYEYNNKDEEKILKHNSIRFFMTIIKQFFIHNKIIYSFPSENRFPKYFFNKENDLIEIAPIYEQNNNYNYLIGSEKQEEEEELNILKYFFGTYNEYLVFDLIFQIDNIYKLVDNIEYIVSGDLIDLKNYIIYKYQIKEKNIIFKDSEDNNLKNDIEIMKNKIKEYDNKNKSNFEKDNFCDKKVNINVKNFKFINITKSENDNIGYDECIKKIEEETELREKAKWRRKLFKIITNSD